MAASTASSNNDESARVCSEPRVVSLASNESKLGGIFLLDTERGTVHWHGCYGELTNPEGAIEDDPYDWAPKDEAEWRAEAPAWAVSDFFELLKGRFRKPYLVPTNLTAVHDVYTGSGPGRKGYTALVQEVYRRRRWPGLHSFCETGCLEAVKNALGERYPGEFE